MKGVDGLSGFLLLSVVAGFVTTIDATTAAPLSVNTGDWSLVSAPPPPGPYQAVNLDPRVPGQIGIRTVGNAPQALQSFGNNMNRMAGGAPASREPETHQPPMNRSSMPYVQGYQAPPQLPGDYQSMIPRSPQQVYPGASQYPGQVGGQNIRFMPPRGYYSPQSFQAEQVVPPPPVYDAMMQAPPGAYQSGAGR